MTNWSIKKKKNVLEVFFLSGFAFNAVHLWRFNFVKIVNQIDGLLHWHLCKLLLFLVWHNVHNVLFRFWGLISGGFSAGALSTKVHLETADLGAPCGFPLRSPWYCWRKFLWVLLVLILDPVVIHNQAVHRFWFRPCSNSYKHNTLTAFPT